MLLLSADWLRNTAGLSSITFEAAISKEPVVCRLKLDEDGKHRPDDARTWKRPEPAELHGSKCFFVWLAFGDEFYESIRSKDRKGRITGDHMWFPCRERKEIDRQGYRSGLRHELKHWVKERFKAIGVPLPSPDGERKREFYPKLVEAITDSNIRGLFARHNWPI